MRLAILSLAITIFTFSSCEKNSLISDQENENLLTELEKSDLHFMLEEEKLARDVYLYLFGKYDQQIFENISASEQKHMDAVMAIFEKYKIENSDSNQLGVFNNESLQILYDELIQKGNLSLEDALQVGATIEDVDIIDLQKAIDNATISDIKEMYEKLLCGSKNHLRAFDGKLKDTGSSYTPQYLSQEQYDLIIYGQHAHCN